EEEDEEGEEGAVHQRANLLREQRLQYNETAGLRTRRR
ncbi:MAG: hypothetical protein K0Q72_804, partial [Armatimonadetes bacterium]|nr:hypothetical protein [Armatimonadota bacterium]